MQTKRLDRAQYVTIKANCAAKINERMLALGLTPAEIQRLTNEEAKALRLERSITMQDLTHYRRGDTLPKGLKLKALAWVLKCRPSDLIPEGMQEGRLLVKRSMNATDDYGYSMRLTEAKDRPGDMVVEARLVLPAEKAYALARALNKQHNIELMRSWGWSEEEIQKHLAPKIVGYKDDNGKPGEPIYG